MNIELPYGIPSIMTAYREEVMVDAKSELVSEKATFNVTRSLEVIGEETLLFRSTTPTLQEVIDTLSVLSDTWATEDEAKQKQPMQPIVAEPSPPPPPPPPPVVENTDAPEEEEIPEEEDEEIPKPKAPERKAPKPTAKKPTKRR
jgi:outer membrane biosynthesis protein TonB